MNNPSFLLVLRETNDELEGSDEGRFATLMEGGYSGRAMYGRQCPAISGSMTACQRFIAWAVNGQIGKCVQSAADADNEEEYKRFRELEGKTNDFVRQVMNFRTDNLGYEIVMYWSDIEWIDEETSENEEEH